MKINLDEIYPPPKRTTIGPHQDYYPDKDLCPELCYWSGHYRCVCGTLTGWRVFDGSYFSLVCSTECYELVTGIKVKWPPKVEKPPEPKPEPKVVAKPEPELHPVEEELTKPKMTKEMIKKLLERRLKGKVK